MHTSSKRKNFLGFDDDGDMISSDDSDNERSDRKEVDIHYYLKNYF